MARPVHPLRVEVNPIDRGVKMLSKNARPRSQESGSQESVGTQFKRRTVTRGMAWSVPVVAVAATAPAFAVSPPTLVVTQQGNACKHPGNPKFYHFTFCFSSTFNLTVTLLRMVVNGETGATLFPTTVVVPAGTTVCKYVDAGLFTNSANGEAELFYSYVVNGTTTVVTGSLKTQVNDLPVCGSPSDASNAPNDDPPHCGPLGSDPLCP